MNAQYEYELAMSEIKDHTKIRVCGKSWKGRRGNALWLHSIMNHTKDLFIPVSIVKGLIEFQDDMGDSRKLNIAEMWVPDWFYSKHSGQFEVITEKV